MIHFSVRDGKFDVVIAAGPGVETWPSIGAQIISSLCAEMGLSVGMFGGENLSVKGVIPLPQTGGIVLVEDIQKRIHRIHSRSIIRFIPEFLFPDPFSGWYSPALIPISTAERLQDESKIPWDSTIAILGTGNRALRFGSKLLEHGTPEVYCIESFTQWKAKRFAGWEVERRRFEMNGGKIIEAKPLQVTPINPLLWQFRIQDSQGIRILEIGRIVSAGPFQNQPSFREYPSGSCLFEMTQTAPDIKDKNVDGWALEENLGTLLAIKMIRALAIKLGSRKEEVNRILKRARGNLKRYYRHREEPFTPAYDGKWISSNDRKKMNEFSGVPNKLQTTKPVASVECFENIPCNLCEISCPTHAIDVGKNARIKNTILNEDACTACGICVKICPSDAISIVKESESQFHSHLTLPWSGSTPFQKNESATLLNRKGEFLGTARVMEASSEELANSNKSLIQLDIPTHLLWDARGLRKTKSAQTLKEDYFLSLSRESNINKKVEIILNGERRVVRDKILVSIALFEMNQNRPGDALLCKDGSCGLCLISVDSVNRPACQTRIHQGMTIRVEDSSPPSPKNQEYSLCPCLEVSESQVVERLRQGNLQSPEAVLSMTHVGEGKCHGRICMGALQRTIINQGIQSEHWIDWRFPWSDWILPYS